MTYRELVAAMKRANTLEYERQKYYRLIAPFGTDEVPSAYLEKMAQIDAALDGKIVVLKEK